MVYSNDPENPKTRISLACVVKQYISVSTGKQITLEGFEGDEMRKQVTISSIEGHPFEITGITCDNEKDIGYTLKTVKEKKEYSLEISNRTFESGSFHGRITLETSSEKKPKIMLLVAGSLKKETVIRPENISFGKINTTTENFKKRKLKKRIKVTDTRGEGFIIEKLEPTSNWIIAETVDLKQPRQHVIVISLDKDKLKKGRFKEKVNVYTNYKKNPLVIEVKGEVI